MNCRQYFTSFKQGFYKDCRKLSRKFTNDTDCALHVYTKMVNIRKKRHRNYADKFCMYKKKKKEVVQTLKKVLVFVMRNP